MGFAERIAANTIKYHLQQFHFVGAFVFVGFRLFRGQ